jgi:hypothetical protein
MRDVAKERNDRERRPAQDLTLISLQPTALGKPPDKRGNSSASELLLP